MQLPSATCCARASASYCRLLVISATRRHQQRSVHALPPFASRALQQRSKAVGITHVSDLQGCSPGIWGACMRVSCKLRFFYPSGPLQSFTDGGFRKSTLIVMVPPVMAWLQCDLSNTSRAPLPCPCCTIKTQRDISSLQHKMLQHGMCHHRVSEMSARHCWPLSSLYIRSDRSYDAAVVASAAQH